MTTEVCADGRNAFWIGLYQPGRAPMQWQWVDGSKLNFTKWDVGQPNNRFINGAVINQFCGFLQYRKYRADVTPGTWDDASCVSPKAAYAVCQFVVSLR
ncbi:C-type lectin domain family 4 member E [Aphelenchoides avenae]|nr:C-type lectin domain family 4 member E [Aphelenchus avenae]